MCTVSMVMQHWIEQPRQVWVQPFMGDQITELLRKAAEYDKINHEPYCEDASKKIALKLLADTWNVKIEFPDEKGKE